MHCSSPHRWARRRTTVVELAKQRRSFRVPPRMRGSRNAAVAYRRRSKHHRSKDVRWRRTSASKAWDGIGPRVDEHSITATAARGGWEDRLTIVTDELLEFQTLVPVIADFDKLKSGVGLRITHEVHGSTWSALRANTLYVAWRGAHTGKALDWWVDRLREPRLKKRLVNGVDVKQASRLDRGMPRSRAQPLTAERLSANDCCLACRRTHRTNSAHRHRGRGGGACRGRAWRAQHRGAGTGLHVGGEPGALRVRAPLIAAQVNRAASPRAWRDRS